MGIAPELISCLLGITIGWDVVVPLEVGMNVKWGDYHSPMLPTGFIEQLRHSGLLTSCVREESNRLRCTVERILDSEAVIVIVKDLKTKLVF